MVLQKKNRIEADKNGTKPDDLSQTGWEGSSPAETEQILICNIGSRELFAKTEGNLIKVIIDYKFLRKYVFTEKENEIFSRTREYFYRDRNESE